MRVPEGTYLRERSGGGKESRPTIKVDLEVSVTPQTPMALPPAPAALKSISPYLQRADELRNKEPVIAYWCMPFHRVA